MAITSENMTVSPELFQSVTAKYKSRHFLSHLLFMQKWITSIFSPLLHLTSIKIMMWTQLSWVTVGKKTTATDSRVNADTVPDVLPRAGRGNLFLYQLDTALNQKQLLNNTMRITLCHCYENPVVKFCLLLPKQRRSWCNRQSTPHEPSLPFSLQGQHIIFNIMWILSYCVHVNTTVRGYLKENTLLTLYRF